MNDLRLHLFLRSRRQTVSGVVDKHEMEIKETTGGVETRINRFVLAHNENAKELGSAINGLIRK